MDPLISKPWLSVCQADKYNLKQILIPLIIRLNKDQFVSFYDTVNNMLMEVKHRHRVTKSSI